MTQYAIVRLSILFSVVAAAGITAIVTAVIRRSSSVAHLRAIHDDVQFVVTTRRWQRVLLRIIGPIFIPIGLFMMLGLIYGTDSSSLWIGIVGAGLAIGGILFLWLAHAMHHMRLEVMRDAVWVFPMLGRQRLVAVKDITRLRPLAGNNVGGIVARSDSRKLFVANRTMLGYPQLIDFLQTHRPDLPIPDAAWPMQQLPQHPAA